MRPIGNTAALAFVAAALWTAAPAAFACGEVFRGDMVTAEREVGATPSGEAATFHVLGAGWFHAAEIVKHGGSSDNTTVTLELDGEPIITASFADLKNGWREINTPMIVVNVRSTGDISTMTIWYAPELKFRALAALRIEVAEEGVNSLKMRTVMNKPAPHEHVAGQSIGNTAALPAFK
ncbi:MAG TPA: hypothetical protein VN496_10310 [Burkholderiales bacterium]|nr:hypothetical protein [Burkholderiales bacterium]